MMFDNLHNKGEKLVYDYLNDKGYQVIDVSRDQDYWTQDIDFIAMKGDRTIKIEVKYDSWINRTNNMFIELISNVDNNQSGWIDYCKADIIFYVDAVANIAYVVKVSDIRDYLQKKEYQIKTAYDYDSDGVVKKCSKGALVDIGEYSLNYYIKAVDLCPNEDIDSIYDW